MNSPRANLAGGQSVMSGRWPSRVWMTVIPSSRAAASTRCSGSIADAQQRYVIAQRGPEAARLQEVALHVDDHERCGLEIEGEGTRLRGHERRHA